ncbi:hypothetical protein Xen7305DRAFT_00053280 [Xenococcus sp. PCC 7305]|uniref:hypothetical protein n=1 Tax=Xenococcus sp. PCC 7305 TaxID=102125 RepID=UPI0002AC819B|nr:hypothetical protein [Xenococcus sp. PCC 7305]ELS05581.1 hypothetical protein Xen7305DRAFT_00053280 [Xenococcus sp. PCC 7305]
MKPQFKTRPAWDKAQILMQPAFIRILDNIRKQLETSPWQGDFKDVTHPIPGYLLCLTKDDISIEVDIWQLCYQVVGTNYRPTLQDLVPADDQTSSELSIDERLLDETGEIDWHLVEAKAQQSVRQVFEQLKIACPRMGEN